MSTLLCTVKWLKRERTVAVDSSISFSRVTRTRTTEEKRTYRFIPCPKNLFFFPCIGNKCLEPRGENPFFAILRVGFFPLCFMVSRSEKRNIADVSESVEFFKFSSRLIGWFFKEYSTFSSRVFRNNCFARCIRDDNHFRPHRRRKKKKKRTIKW